MVEPVATAAFSGRETLSPEQEQVVMAPPGPLLVLSGAGSGKTRALTHRVAYFLRAGVKEERILLLTFTNHAAREMLSRVQHLCQRSLSGLWAGTFHHLAVRVLRREGYRIGFSSRFTVLDRSDAADLLGACLAESPLAEGRSPPRGSLLLSLLSLSVSTERPLAEIIATQAPEWLELTAELSRACDRYALRKLSLGLVDFDDLLLGWRLLLGDHPEVRAQQQAQFMHLFIDEYQDTSRIEGAIIDDIAAGHRSLTAVGDDAQSIYAFRGAALDNLLRFRERYPDARVLHLSTNYRSHQDIVTLCNASIEHNADRQARERRQMQSAVAMPAGERREVRRPVVVALPDARLQAVFVVQRIAELLKAGRAPSDIAVLYRSHRQARELQVELLQSGLPYAVRSGQRLGEQTHIKDALAFLRLACSLRDRLAWARVLRQVDGVGDKGRSQLLREIDARLSQSQDPTLDERLLRHVRPAARLALHRLFVLLSELRALTESADTPAQSAALPGRLLRRVLDAHYTAYAGRSFTDAAQRLRDLAQLEKSAEKLLRQPNLPALGCGQEALLSFLSALAAGEGSEDGGSDGSLVLSTVHRAKGLEWAVVFVIWVAEGYFPPVPALAEDSEGMALAEERRLFYVAATRAREELYFCYPEASAFSGGVRESRFLGELSGGVFERWGVRIT